MCKTKVLVIDDDEAAGEVLARMLDSLGLDATFLHNPTSAPLDEEAIKEALKTTYLVFSDGRMSGPDGAVVIGLALKTGIGLDRITIVTGFLHKDLERRIKAFDGVRILYKPFKLVQLREIVKAMLPVTV